MPNPVTRSALFRFGLSATLLLTAVTLFWSPAEAEEPAVVSQHSRGFRVLVDGKPRGNQTMTFIRRKDGSEVMRGEVEVVMNFVVYRYRYASAGSETWKDGRLVQLANEADYNGEKYVLQASATGKSLNYVVNGETQKAPTDIWVSSYWREPDAKRVGQKVRLLDSDKGRQMTATLERLDPESLKHDTTTIKANRYRMRGDVEVDVWYDQHGLIVRQESVESGHKTLLELTKIQKGQ